MAIQINPEQQAEIEIIEALRDIDAPAPPDAVGGRQGHLARVLMGVVERALHLQRLMFGQHDQCGAVNPEGKAALCQCYCHKGHYKHAWVPIIKTPVLNADGTYHLMDRCKYCPDIRLQIIKPAFVGGKHTLVSLGYIIRGEQQVLTKEEYQEKVPKQADMKLIRTVGL